MQGGFTNVIESSNLNYKIQFQKIDDALEGLLEADNKNPKLLKALFNFECGKLNKPYLELMIYYVRSKQVENYDAIITAFLNHYENFTSSFTSLIKYHIESKNACWVITCVWLEILEKLEDEAKAQNDSVARSIAIQMQTDIAYIFVNTFS
jgi:adenine-specific DNA methylase